MIKGVTKTGFGFELDESVFDDLEILERINEADNNLALLPGLLKDFLGKDQYNALKEFIRGENGRVKTTAMAEAFAEIMEAAGEANKDVKN